MKKILQYLHDHQKLKFSLVLLLFAVFIGIFATKLPVKLFAQENDECLGCHEDKTLTMQKGKKTVSLFVNPKKLNKSIHAGVKCIQCHVGFDPGSFPHVEGKPKYQCGSCHKDEQALYNECLHGKAKAKGDPLAPTCKTCHGSHEILPRSDKESSVYPLNIPRLCGGCHREGSPVQMQRNIPQSHIYENYQESIHGEGLIKKGLTVSATCASCHTPHRILPHTDPRSSISRKNIAATCTKCHAGIEFVHKKIIKGELWEKEAKVLPACIDCHQPHKVRKVFYEQNLSDVACKNCHEKKTIGKSADGRNMFVDHGEILTSTHSKLTCTQCHLGVNPSSKIRACETLTTSKVECAACHTAVGNDFVMGTHGKLVARNDPDAPRCKDCHGTHFILTKGDKRSKVFSMNIPKLCSTCHQEGKKAALRYKGTQHSITSNYDESIHGRGLVKSGLTVTATCADCHTPHKGLPKDNPQSSINQANIAGTCGKCHFGIEDVFNKSVHSPSITKTDKKLPVCSDCHSAHTIKRTDQWNFRHEILSTCGKCHEEIAKTYFETYHGKVSWLGSYKSAKCNDCHGSHMILPIDNPKSALSRDNIVQTCQKCHPNATKGFTKYLSHATHKDPKKYPFLFYTFWGMTLLLLGTFSVSFLHTLLWLPRSFKLRKKMKELHASSSHDKSKMYERFSGLSRLIHFTMICSFLTLAATGMILKFSYTIWANIGAGLLGGVENAGTLHRYAAIVLFTIFIIHIVDLFRKKNSEYKTWKNMLLGPDSLVPNLKDLEDMKASIKWFIGKGERPNYGRWTYWEKFDYFAVFWGVFVIGGTGLTLWFPELLTNIFPGWMINVATIIHSDEALLAAGFIFTVHFFNTHFRPEKFQMDTVIFSGQMTMEELKFDRPDEYRRLVESGKIDNYSTTEFSPKMLKLLKVFGFFALTFGLLLVAWIIYAMIII